MRELHPCRLICQWGTGTEESGWQTCRTCQFSDKCPPPICMLFLSILVVEASNYNPSALIATDSICCIFAWQAEITFFFLFSRLYETLHASHMKRPAWVFILLMLRVSEHVTTSSRRVREEYIHLWFVKKVPSLSLFWVFFIINCARTMHFLLQLQVMYGYLL